jgi:hypothetical protein
MPRYKLTIEYGTSFVGLQTRKPLRRIGVSHLIDIFRPVSQAVGQTPYSRTVRKARSPYFTG